MMLGALAGAALYALGRMTSTRPKMIVYVMPSRQDLRSCDPAGDARSPADERAKPSRSKAAKRFAGSVSAQVVANMASPEVHHCIHLAIHLGRLIMGE